MTTRESSLKAFLKRAYEFKQIQEDVGSSIRKLEDSCVERPTWTQEQEKAIFDEIRPWVRLVLRFIQQTGCRPKEACELKIKDIDWKRNAFVLRTRKGNRLKERWLPMIGELSEVLVQAILGRESLEDAHVFLNARGKKVSPVRIAEEVRLARKILRLPDGLVPYGLRHTMMSRLDELGVGMGQIQAIAGHSRLETTQRYIHANGDAIKTALNLVHSTRKSK